MKMYYNDKERASAFSFANMTIDRPRQQQKEYTYAELKPWFSGQDKIAAKARELLQRDVPATDKLRCMLDEATKADELSHKIQRLESLNKRDEFEEEELKRCRAMQADPAYILKKGRRNMYYRYEISRLVRELGEQGLLPRFVSPLATKEEEEDDKKEVTAKLTVSRPGDKQELEADAIAEQVTRDEDDKDKEKDEAQASPSQISREGGGEQEVPAATDAYIQNLSGGQQLGTKEKEFFERKLQADFSSVKIHTDTKAEAAAASIGAKAFTKGDAIVFGEGEYKPDTKEGKKLLAHELAHVVQQERGNISREEKNNGNKSQSFNQINYNAFKQEGFEEGRRGGLVWQGEHRINNEIIVGLHNADAYIPNYLKTSSYASWSASDVCEFPRDAEPIRPELGFFNLRVCLKNVLGRLVQYARFFIRKA